MIGQGTQDVDCAAFDVIGLKLASEGNLPAFRRNQSPRGGVIVKSTLKRAKQQIAFGAVGGMTRRRLSASPAVVFRGSPTSAM
jgi:hypothetical protein